MLAEGDISMKHTPEQQLLLDSWSRLARSAEEAEGTLQEAALWQQADRAWAEYQESLCPISALTPGDIIGVTYCHDQWYANTCTGVCNGRALFASVHVWPDLGKWLQHRVTIEPVVSQTDIAEWHKAQALIPAVYAGLEQLRQNLDVLVVTPAGIDVEMPGAMGRMS